MKRIVQCAVLLSIFAVAFHPHTAMAKTVGLPAAIATKMILSGEIHKTGVVIPVTPDIYNPLLDELANQHHIRFTETLMVNE